jgi:hypothetical protein
MKKSGVPSNHSTPNHIKTKVKKTFDKFSDMMKEKSSMLKGTFLEFIPEYHEWKGQRCPSNELSYKVFHNSLFFIKIFGIVFFIGLMIWNLAKYKNGYLITDKPVWFILESFVFGISVVIPLLFSWWLRKGSMDSTKFTKLAGIGFIIFFILNFILEASGFWTWVFNYGIHESFTTTTVPTTTVPTTTVPTTQKLNNSELLSCQSKTIELEQELQRIKTIPSTPIKASNNIFSDLMNGNVNIFVTLLIGLVIVIIIYGVIVMISAANFVNKSIINDDGTDIYENNILHNTLGSNGTFLIEMLVFGIVSSVPLFLMARNREDLNSGTVKEFLLGTVKFSILFYVLQYSSFWGELFGEAPVDVSGVSEIFSDTK